MAEQLILSSGGSCQYGELTENIAMNLCAKLESVCNMVRECGLFKIAEDYTVTLKRSTRKAGAIDPTSDEDFVDVWEAYGKKASRETAFRAWKRLSKEEQDMAKAHIPHYVLSTPELQFRPYLATYLNQHRFLEPVINKQGQVLYDPAKKVEVITQPTLQGFQG